eukprot:scaffold78497_cov18-Tisochrysis_lutea.AAC.1
MACRTVCWPCFPKPFASHASQGHLLANDTVSRLPVACSIHETCVSAPGWSLRDAYVCWGKSVRS